MGISRWKRSEFIQRFHEIVKRMETTLQYIPLPPWDAKYLFRNSMRLFKNNVCPTWFRSFCDVPETLHPQLCNIDRPTKDNLIPLAFHNEREANSFGTFMRLSTRWNKKCGRSSCHQETRNSYFEIACDCSQTTFAQRDLNHFAIYQKPSTLNCATSLSPTNDNLIPMAFHNENEANAYGAFMKS
jgi:hypothetical protein